MVLVLIEVITRVVSIKSGSLGSLVGDQSLVIVADNYFSRGE
jgi:hypothetical protein